MDVSVTPICCAVLLNQNGCFGPPALNVAVGDGCVSRPRLKFKACADSDLSAQIGVVSPEDTVDNADMTAGSAVYASPGAVILL